MQKTQQDTILDRAMEYVSTTFFVVGAGCLIALMLFGIVKVGDSLVNQHYSTPSASSANGTSWVDASSSYAGSDAYNSGAAVPQTKPVTPDPIRVLPAVGNTNGVHRVGTSLNDNPSTRSWNRGMTYRWNRGVQTFGVLPSGGVEYHGANILFVQQHSSGQRAGAAAKQQYVTLNFSGDLTYLEAHAISLIVYTGDTHAYIHHDDRLVNLSPAKITDQGIRLRTADFIPGDSSGFIRAIKFCMN
jgi:hypothetical protein